MGLVGFFEVLRGEEHGRSESVDAPDLVPHRESTGRVEAGGGFVEEQHVRAVDECRCEIEAAFHPSQVALHPAVGGVQQIDQLEQLLRTLSGIGR